jgi:hypothetical protein
MSHDHDHHSFHRSTSNNGHWPTPSEAGALEAQPHPEALVGQPEPAGPRNDDSARKADDALMRCYNG